MGGLDPQAAAGRLPLTVIGGYLGAGKTTLLNRLLVDSQGLRLAVIVNDFGSVNIDASLIANRQGETISLANGCVCCTIADNLALTLHDFAERADGPQHIVVEASGVAEPARIAGYAASHPRLVLDGIVTVADAETVRARADDKYVGDLVRCQLASADLVLLSKTDLAGAEASRQVRDWIAATMPGPRVVPVPASGPLAGLLLAAGGGEAVSRPSPQEAGHERQFATWTFTRRTPLDEAALRRAIAALPASVVRAKGVVSLAGASGHRFVLQLVGRRWSLEPQDCSAAPAPFNASTIVFIGLTGQLEPEHLAALFASTVAVPLPSAAGALLREGGRA
jgi:G3E family GTPase